MELLCLEEINQPLDFFFNLSATLVLVKKLSIQGMKLITEALRQKIKVYSGNAKNMSKTTKWLQHKIHGTLSCPTIQEINLSNKVLIRDYNNYDKEENPTIEDMQQLGHELINNFITYTPSGYPKIPVTCGKIVRNKIELLSKTQIHKSAKSEKDLTSIESQLASYNNGAFMGGGVGLTDLADNICPIETHVDFHQIYSYILTNYTFPNVLIPPTLMPGFFKNPFAIYHVTGGQVRLKRDGFPIIVRTNNRDILNTYDWIDINKVIYGAICDPDLNTLYENYDIRDLEIEETLIYQGTFNGKTFIGPTIEELYQKRMSNTGSVKRFYKLINENIAGSFEQGIQRLRGYWKDLDTPGIEKKKIFFNGAIGVFITAYGRQLLSGLLHMFPHNKVIGYDTDCVFFAGSPEEVPTKVKRMFGNDMGKLHFDGIYKDVYHFAIKQYMGIDMETGKPFGKMSGVPNANNIAAQLMEDPDQMFWMEVIRWDYRNYVYYKDEEPIKLNTSKYKEALARYEK